MQIPLLFPIALFGIVNMYVNERLLLAYYYKQPPIYDMDLHQESLRKVKLAPILCFLFGCWTFGNTHIFYNQADFKEYRNEKTNPNHYVFSDKGYDATQPSFIFFIIAVMVQFGNFNYSIFDKYFKIRSTRKLDLNEHLGTYWSCLSAYHQKLWYTSETYKRKVLKIKTISEDNLEILRKQKNEKSRTLIGYPNYDILSNLQYADMF